MNQLITEILEGVQNDTLSKSQLIEKLENLQGSIADLDSAANKFLDILNP